MYIHIAFCLVQGFQVSHSMTEMYLGAGWGGGGGYLRVGTPQAPLSSGSAVRDGSSSKHKVRKVSPCFD